ncbi:MmgE/PrpD family protein [Pseudonocardia nantongensis]|uniref:MmgE/PrpD family protein n=1 Tax=Pseudonocardia nantongensis TaxID=1181885 RepID=UPI00397ABB32
MRGPARRVTTATELSDVPEQVVRQASLSVLDPVACAVAGAATPETRAVLAAESEFLPPGRSPVLTTGTRTAPEAVARSHGYRGDVFELNGLIGGARGHGGRGRRRSLRLLLHDYRSRAPRKAPTWVPPAGLEPAT